MKKKWLALLLGMALSLTSVCALAEEETETETFEIMTGRVEAIVSDTVFLVSAGDLVEDETDSSVATLILSGIMYEVTFSDDASGVQTIVQKAVTVEEAAEEETETGLAESADTAEEATDGETEITDAEEETETETETETEEEVEEISLADLQVGDIIEYTIRLDGENLAVSFVLIGTEK